MSIKKTHSKEANDPTKEMLDIISKSSIKWDKTSEQVWAGMESKLTSAKIPERKIFFTPHVRIALAASILLLLGIILFMQLRIRTIVVPPGEHSHLVLPDKSQVELNAQSTLSYKPLQYLLTRKIKLEGEAFFKVRPGNKFEVHSSMGVTRVLGTSFNIYSRENVYSVTCLSGSVEVMSKKQKCAVFLKPDEVARINEKGTLEVQNEHSTAEAISWVKNRFSFTSVSLTEVFKEIERQYGITIQVPSGINEKYTGTFNRTASVEAALNLVCRPFNLTYTRKSGHEYIISSIE